MKKERFHRRLLTVSLSVLLAISLWGCQTAPDPDATSSTSASGTETTAQTKNPILTQLPGEVIYRVNKAQTSADIPFQAQQVSHFNYYVTPDGYLTQEEFPLYNAPTVIRSVEELNTYLSPDNPYREKFQIYEHVLEACQRYDESFFQSHTLVIIRRTAGDSSYAYRVGQNTLDEAGRCTILLYQMTYGAGFTAPVSHHIFVELNTNGQPLQGVDVQTEELNRFDTFLPYNVQYAVDSGSIPPEHSIPTEASLVIRSTEELSAYLSEFDVPQQSSSSQSDELTTVSLPKMKEALQKYDAAYFEEKILVLVRLVSPESATSYSLAAINYENEQCTILVKTTRVSIGYCEIETWHIMLEIDADVNLTEGSQITTWVVE